MEKIISIIISIGSIIGMIYAFHKWYYKKRKDFILYSNYVKGNFFYPLSFIKDLISNNTSLLSSENDYINFSLALRNGYYSKSIKKLSIKIDNEIKEIEIPYSEIINYIENPTSSIKITTSELSGQFKLLPDIINRTDYILSEFLLKKPNTYNGKTLRINKLEKKDANSYSCTLQTATYFDQIRTNLTLDMPLKGEEEETIRIKDLSGNGTLKPLSESIMANTIGVSAIWYTPTLHNSIKGGIRFFLMPRKSQTGVYYNSLGSISGVVEPPISISIDNGNYNITNTFDVDCLEKYVSKEILREFYEETNYKEYMTATNIDEKEIKIIPLAFLRELTRGGKPQFMFAIRTPYIDDDSMMKFFKKSINGLEEFNNSFISRIRTYKLSPETYVNLLYTLRYIQNNHSLQYIDLNK